MAIVFIPAQLRELTGGVQQMDVEAATLREVLAALETRFPGIRARLCDADGALAPGLAVSIDGNLTTKGLLAKVVPSSEIHFLPAIGGG